MDSQTIFRKKKSVGKQCFVGILIYTLRYYMCMFIIYTYTCFTENLSWNFSVEGGKWSPYSL